MFAPKKIAKCQRFASQPFYLYRLHQEEITWEQYLELWSSRDKLSVTTIDIGLRNLLLRIAERDSNEVRTLLYEKVSFNEVETDKMKPREIFWQIERYFEQFRDYLQQSDVIIIEWQLHDRYKNVRISTFLLAYFQFLLKNQPHRPLLIEMRSEFKHRYFDQLKALNQNARKKEGINISLEVMEKLADERSYQIITGAGLAKSKRPKQDDFADAYLMEESFFLYLAEHGLEYHHS